jgi:hypothetical protein
MHFPYTLDDWYAQEGRSQWQRGFFEGRLQPDVLKADPAATVMVVSHHTCFSRVLPVVMVASLKHGVRVWMRDNTFNWAVTVESETPVSLKGDPARRNSNNLEEHLFEGFAWRNIPIHGPHEQNPARFSFHSGGEDDLLEIVVGLLGA